MLQVSGGFGHLDLFKSDTVVELWRWGQWGGQGKVREREFTEKSEGAFLCLQIELGRVKRDEGGKVR